CATKLRHSPLRPVTVQHGSGRVLISPASGHYCGSTGDSVTMMPSESAYTYSPGLNSTPPKRSTTSFSPAPVFVDLRGLVPSALQPKSISPMALLSRIAALTITPAQPFFWPRPAMMSPTSAVCRDSWPSMTSTPPGFGSLRMDFSSALSWKQDTVVMRPQNSTLPPRSWNCVSQERDSAPMMSTKSAVGIKVISFIAFKHRCWTTPEQQGAPLWAGMSGLPGKVDGAQTSVDPTRGSKRAHGCI